MTARQTPGESMAEAMVPGVHRLDPRTLMAAAVVGFGQAGWATAVIDLSAASDKPALLEAFARDLSFPSWVGRNWDALDDAMRDLSWWPAGERGRALLLVGLERAGVGSEDTGMGTPDDRAVIRDVLESATARWSASDQPLIVLLVD